MCSKLQFLNKKVWIDSFQRKTCLKKLLSAKPGMGPPSEAHKKVITITFQESLKTAIKRERVPVLCVMPACQPDVLPWPPDISTSGGGASSSEQVWIGLLWWSPGVTNGGARGSNVWCPGGEGQAGGPCTVRSNTSWVTGTPPLWTDTTENITFPQLHWRKVEIKLMQRAFQGREIQPSNKLKIHIQQKCETKKTSNSQHYKPCNKLTS